MNAAVILRTFWRQLPHGVRDTAIFNFLKSELRKFLSPSLPVKFDGQTKFDEEIVDLNTLDSALKYAAYLEEQDQDRFHTFVNSLKIRPPDFFNKIEDPYSKEFANAHRSEFEWLRGHSYNVNNESLPVYVKETIATPYPYRTKSFKIVGKHLKMIGALIELMDLKPQSKILEMGPGQGSLTIPLAQLGCDVTCVDISQSFLKIVKARLGQVGRRARLVNKDFLEVESLGSGFDAVVFHACFHHCSDHQKLIQILSRMVKPGGKIFFSGEPIYDNHRQPWSLRLDGESVYHIRLHGWLELGFQHNYFRDLLSTYGWTFEKTIPHGVSDPVFIATKNSNL